MRPGWIGLVEFIRWDAFGHVLRPPGIEDWHVETGQVVLVTGHERQAMHQRRCRDEGIEDRRRRAARSAAGDDRCPGFGDGALDADDPPVEARSQIAIEPGTNSSARLRPGGSSSMPSRISAKASTLR